MTMVNPLLGLYTCTLGRNGSTIAETSILTPLVPISLYIFGTYWFLQFDDMTDIEAQVQCAPLGIN